LSCNVYQLTIGGVVYLGVALGCICTRILMAHIVSMARFRLGSHGL
jgi:hypothetical protein